MFILYVKGSFSSTGHLSFDSEFDLTAQYIL